MSYSISEVNACKQELVAYYRQRNVKSQTWRRMARGYVETKYPGSDTMNVRLPTSFAIVHLATNLLTVQRPRYRVPPSKETKKAYEAATQLEMFLQGAWYRNERERKNHARERATWHAVVDGWFAFKTLWDVDAEEKGKWPILIKSVDPLSVFPQPTDERPEYVLETYMRPAGEVRKRYEAELKGNLFPGKKDTDLVEWTEWWDEERVIYICENIEVKNEEHGYGFVPYSIGQGVQTPLMDGDAMGMSMLEPIADVLRHQQRLFANEAAIIEKYAWPTILVESPQADKFELDTRPGGVNFLLPGDSVTYLEWKSTLPEVKQIGDEVSGHIDRATFSGLQYGEKQPSGTSGYLGSILASSTQIKLHPIKRSIELGMEDVNEMVLRLVEKFANGPLSVDGVDHRNKNFSVRLNSNDIDGYYNNIVELRATLPEDEVQKAMTGLRLVQAGIISRQTARDRYAEVDSPEQEEENILREKLQDHPLMMSGLAVEAAKRWGLDTKEIQAQLDQAKQPGGGAPAGAPAGGAPTGPPGAPPGASGPPGALPAPTGAGGPVRGYGGMPGVPVPNMQALLRPPGRTGPLPGTGGRPPGQKAPMMPGISAATTSIGSPLQGMPSVNAGSPVPRDLRRLAGSGGRLMPLAPPPPPPIPGMAPVRSRVPAMPDVYMQSSSTPILPLPRRR